MAAMDTSAFWLRDNVGPGPYPNPLDIPTPPLQRAAIFIMFFLPALATVIFSLRIYSRLTTRTIGIDDYLCGLALVSDNARGPAEANTLTLLTRSRPLSST